MRSRVRRGVSIRATKCSKYSQTPEKVRQEREGRAARVMRGGLIWRRCDGGDRNPIERDSRWGNVARQVAITSGDMYPEFGISSRWRRTMRGKHKINLGNDGNGMLPNRNDCRHGADPPKNVSGSAGTDSSVEFSERCVKTGSGLCSIVTNFSSTGPRISKMWTRDMRSRDSSAASRFSMSSLSTTGNGGGSNKTMGKAGQICSNLLVGVVLVHLSRKSRRRGDPKTRYRHRRHTCVSVFHLHVKLI